MQSAASVVEKPIQIIQQLIRNYPLHVPTAVATQILNVIDSRWKEKNPFQTRGERSLVKFMMSQHSLNRLQAKTLFAHDLVEIEKHAAGMKKG